MSHISRRHLIKGSAWTAPVVLAATSVPAYAASTCATLTYKYDRVNGNFLINNTNGGAVKSLTVRISGWMFDTSKIDPTLWAISTYKHSATYIGSPTSEPVLSLPLIDGASLKEQSYTIPVEEVNASSAEWESRFNNSVTVYAANYANAKNDQESYVKWLNNVSAEGLYRRQEYGWVPITRLEFQDNGDGGYVFGYDDNGQQIVRMMYFSLSLTVRHTSYYQRVTTDPVCPRPVPAA